MSRTYDLSNIPHVVAVLPIRGFSVLIPFVNRFALSVSFAKHHMDKVQAKDALESKMVIVFQLPKMAYTFALLIRRSWS